jgi:hypothetical protein
MKFNETLNRGLVYKKGLGWARSPHILELSLVFDTSISRLAATSLSISKNVEKYK